VLTNATGNIVGLAPFGQAIFGGPAVIVLMLGTFGLVMIKEMYSVNDDGTVAGRKAVMGALRLYLDFINLLLFLLRFLGNRRWRGRDTFGG
jgi:FtsH-binding integral membrane protein